MEAIKDDPLDESDGSEEEEEEEEEDLGEEDQVEQHEGLPIELKQGDSQGEPIEGPLDEPEDPPKGKENEYSRDVDGLSPSILARELSRSPPQSRSTSPSSLAKMTAALSLSSSKHSGIKDIVSSDLTKQRARQQQKYHSKRGAQRIGRPKGSKAKQDNRVKMDKSGFWE